MVLELQLLKKTDWEEYALTMARIPSKLLIHSADVAETIKRASLFGIKVDGYAIESEQHN